MARRRSNIQHFAFRDVLANGLLAWVLLALLFMAMVKVAAKQEIEANLQVNDTLVFQISWPDAAPHDIDLWVRGPGDLPVGFSRKSGVSLNLLRDDLGRGGDITPQNWEETRSRGLPAGEYAATVHLWNPSGGELPVTVDASVSIVQGKTSTVIWEGSVELVRDNQELTLVRFTLDAEGHLVPGSVNHLATRLWQADQ